MEKTIFTPFRPPRAAEGSVRWFVTVLSMALLLLVSMATGRAELQQSGSDGQGQLSAATQGEISQGAHTMIYRCENSPDISFRERLPGQASLNRPLLFYFMSTDVSALSTNAIRGPSKTDSRYFNRLFSA